MSLYSHSPQIKSAETERFVCVCLEGGGVQCQCQMLGHTELPWTGLMCNKETPAHTYTSEEVGVQNKKLDHAPEGHPHTHTHTHTGARDRTHPPTHTFPLMSLTLTPSILNPRVAVELMVSLHCMYLGLVTTFCRFSSGVGASGSTSIIF